MFVLVLFYRFVRGIFSLYMFFLFIWFETSILHVKTEVQLVCSFLVHYIGARTDKSLTEWGVELWSASLCFIRI